MIRNLIRHIKSILKNLFLDKNEKRFVKYCFQNKPKVYKINKKKILVQVVTDYYYLAYYKSLFLDGRFLNCEVIGLWPYFQRTVRPRNFILEIFNEFYLAFYDYIEFLKWQKLYQSIGVNKVERLNINLFDRINYILKKKKINIFLKQKSIFNLSINNIKIGSILYDTYLRYRARPTLLINDKFFLKKLIYKSSIVCLKLEKIYKKYKFKEFYTSYSSYIQHGIPVRFFLKKKINVFSGKNNSQYNKKLSKYDMYHSESYKKYYSMKKNIKNQKKILNISKKDLKLRFSNRNENKMNYLFVNTYITKNYKKTDIELIKNLDGVIFLQDFYDSPHDWGKLVFDDFYKWTIYSLNIIKKNNLKIGIKPHPNSWHNSPDSILIYERLKEKFPNITWLDKNYPNEIIFKNIDFGISCTGTVLFELAYHNIKAISCGDHPGINFNFTINAKDKIEYKNLLLNAKNLKLPNYTNNDLLIYNYLYNHKNMDAYNNLARKINLKEIDFSESKSLHQFIKRINNDHKY